MAVVTLYPLLANGITTHSSGSWPSTSTVMSVGVTNVNPDVHYEALIKFDMSQIPSGAQITGATLHMQCTKQWDGSQNMSFYRNTSDFTEATIYNTRPSIDTSTKKLFEPPKVIGTVSYDVLSMLDTVNPMNNRYGFTLTVDNKKIYGHATFETNRGTVKPYLVVSYNIAPTIKATIPTQFVKKNANVTLNLANYFSDADGDALTYTATSSNTNIATAAVSGNTLTLTGKTIGSATITVTASDGQLTVSQSFTLNVTNTAPTVSISSPSANMTLYENNTFNVAGSASDVDTNQSVTVYAQVNNEQRIALAVGLSNAPITFNKQLKFKGGKLYDGDTLITGNLTDGVPHTLKIWAQDGEGGQSAITERAFYVVPNRPPILTVDTVQPNGIINTDKFTVSGDASDPDGNPVTAAYRINGGNSVALEIIDGKWAFDITLAQLQVGQNTIAIELTDSYNFKVSKTIKLNKDEVKTPILQSVARYKIEPPKGSAKGVLLWIQRDNDLADLKVELSMTLQGEQENYVTLTATNTAPVDSETVEDEFYFEATEAKNNIILKLSTSRAEINIDHKIHLISGVLE